MIKWKLMQKRVWMVIEDIKPMTFLSMRNTFNNLLMVLACLDSTFLVLAMLDYSIARGHHHHNHHRHHHFCHDHHHAEYNCPPLVFEWPFSHTGQLYAVLFPKLLHPLNTTLVTCQTYLIVVIAFER